MTLKNLFFPYKKVTEPKVMNHNAFWTNFRDEVVQIFTVNISRDIWMSYLIYIIMNHDF